MSYCPTEIWPTYVWSLDTRVKYKLLTTAVSERQTVWNQISKKKNFIVYTAFSKLQFIPQENPWKR